MTASLVADDRRRGHRLRGLIARTGPVTALCLAGALTLSAAPAAPAAPATSADPLARYHHQHLTWKSCLLGPDDETGKELAQAGAQCTDVTVPLDYTHPEDVRSPSRSPGSGPPTPRTASARSCSTAAAPAGRRSVIRHGCARR
ncbi:hypothetical protein GA0115258_111287 [Streptomyces sp. LamerLS-31b]|nr:hypothetical protein GA0115258_111287 [Streptomyces sp. LamerLS-31b]